MPRLEMATQMQLVNLNRFNRGILMVGSLMFPLVGIIAGLWYIVRPEYKNDKLGYWCLGLGIISMIAYGPVIRYFILS